MNTIRAVLQRLGRKTRGHSVTVLFFALTFMQTTAIWLQRAFPTQDGPMQLYYADVLSGLLRGGGTYSAYFRMNS
ncbi:MAG TPA: hypothetical protein VNV86_03215 [Candidatus Acidoferrum sp.]|nr:hypothetical protein [Candidatus Acidoferrum sp.]